MLRNDAHTKMMQKAIYTKDAPAPIGPYSQAILAGSTLYISGQIALNPKTGELETDDIERETRRVMSNLKSVLQAAGADFENVVKCSIFLSDMNTFGQINDIYGEYFQNDTPPARETVEVSVLPKNVNVEISAIAVLP